MKTLNLLALGALLASCLATLGQPVITTTTAPAPVPPLVSADNPLINPVAGDEVVDVVAFDTVPLPDAIRTLALQAGLNIEFDPRLLNAVTPDGRPIPPPTVTEKWHKVTAMQALQALLDNWNWELTWNPHTHIGRVTARDPNALEPLLVTVYQLRYGNPTNIIPEVLATLSARSSMIPDMRTHQLVIRTTEKELAGVEALIAQLDTATRQVLIEAKIIETTKDITSAKGVNWTGTLAAQHVSFGNGITSGSSTTGTQTSSAGATTVSTTTPSGAPVSGTTGGGVSTLVSNVTSFTTSIAGVPSAGGGFSLSTAHGLTPATAFLSADGVSAVLSFLNTDADTKSIAFPRTVTLDGVPTMLAVVQNIPVFEQTQSAPAAGAVAGLATVQPNYELKAGGTILNEVGVKLTVTPRIAGPTNVIMDLRPEISQQDALQASDTLDGQVNTAPIFDRRSIVTQASVPSGYTLILGGLDNDSLQKTYTKVPFLGDIPGLGNLFKSSAKADTRDTILIFVTPTIIGDSDYQPTHSDYLQQKSYAPFTSSEAPWDTGAPYDWTKPASKVTPDYEQ